MEHVSQIPPGSTPGYELNRSAYLEYLYRLDGRDNPSHPRHSLYTGLAQEYRYQLGLQVEEEIVRRWDEFRPEMEAHLASFRAAVEGACSPSTLSQ